MNHATQKLFLQQKRLSYDCRHLKSITYQTIVNPLTDDTETHPFCEQCGKLLDILEMKQREETLERFNNLKLQ